MRKCPRNLGGSDWREHKGQGEMVRCPALWPGALVRVGSWELAQGSPEPGAKAGGQEMCVRASALPGAAAASPGIMV